MRFSLCSGMHTLRCVCVGQCTKSFFVLGSAKISPEMPENNIPDGGLALFFDICIMAVTCYEEKELWFVCNLRSHIMYFISLHGITAIFDNIKYVQVVTYEVALEKY